MGGKRTERSVIRGSSEREVGRGGANSHVCEDGGTKSDASERYLFAFS